MRKAMIVGTMALAGFGICNGQDAETTGYNITVDAQDQQVANPLVLARAKALATSVFDAVGVHVRWELGGPRKALDREPQPDATIVIRFATRTPAEFHRGAPAFSLPYAPESEVRVTVLYDRVLGSVGGGHNAGASLLGHVLAHEITDMLQGLVRHSETRIMKARWTSKDRAQMRTAPLPFTTYDAELMHRSMSKDKKFVEIAGR